MQVFVLYPIQLLKKLGWFMKTPLSIDHFTKIITRMKNKTLQTVTLIYLNQIYLFRPEVIQNMCS